MTDRYLTPQRIVPARFGPAGLPHWDAAVLCFRDLRGSLALVEGLRAMPVGRKVLWGMDEPADLPHVYQAEVAGRAVAVVTRCLWGGPQAAILVEELSFMGVQYLLGYGAAGSIDPGLPQGTQIAVSRALLTDGTSRHYARRAVAADRQLLALAGKVTAVTAATVDAVYCETPPLVRRWRRQGAQIVNMEAAPFYAAAARCGVRSLWLGHVSDVLAGDWQDWFVDRSAMNRQSVENCINLIAALPQ